jgi:hypothetical protein
VQVRLDTTDSCLPSQFWLSISNFDSSLVLICTVYSVISEPFSAGFSHLITTLEASIEVVGGLGVLGTVAHRSDTV